MYPRFSEILVRSALRDTRVVAVSGPRQSGKTTLARRFAQRGRIYVTLDNQPTLAAAKSDPVAFIRGLDRTIIDEVQRAPDLLLAIKQSVDEDPRPGRPFTRAKLKEAELESQASYAEQFPQAPTPAKATRKEVDVVIAQYLKDCAATLAPKTVSGKEHTLDEWRKVCTKKYMDELDKTDLLAFVASMKEEGLADRTCANRIESVTSFLLAHKKDCPLGMAIHNKEVRVKVKYTEKVVKAYTSEELKKLFDAACHDEWEIFQFFLLLRIPRRGSTNHLLGEPGRGWRGKGTRPPGV